MKVLKTLLWLFGILVFLAIGTVLVVTTIIDPNDFKPKIEAAVLEKTGRKLDVQGDLDITYYPWIGLKTGAVKFANRDGYGDEPMLSVEKINIRAKLMPLLKKELEIGEVLLTNPEIRLTTLEDGSTNWGDLIPSIESGHSSNERSEGEFLAGLAVQGVSIENGTLVIDDRAAQQSLSVAGLNLSTGEIQPGNPIDFELSMNVEGNMVPAPAFIELASTINLNETFDFIKLDDTNLNINLDDAANALTIPTAEINLAKQTASIPDFNLKGNDLNIDGSVAASNIFASPALTGQLSAKASDLQNTLTEFGIDLGFSDEFLKNLNISTGFGFLNNIAEIKNLNSDFVMNEQSVTLQLPFAALDLDKQSLDVSELKIDNPNGKVAITAKGTNVLSDIEDMDLAGTLQLDSPNLENLLTMIGLSEILPSGLFERISSSMSYALQNGKLVLSSMDTSIDDATLSGNLNYQGRSDSDNANLAIKQNISGIDVGKVLAALDIAKNFEGAGNLNLDLNQIVPDAENPISNLSGEFDFKVRDGAIKGFDLQAALVKLNDLIKGGNILNAQSDYSPAVETKFAELSGSFQGQNGRFQTNNIVMKAPAVRVSGAGILDLNGESLDFDLDVSMDDSVEGQGGTGLESLSGLTIPLTISGSFDAPKYGLDVSKLLKEKVESEVKEKVEEKVNEANQAIEEKVKDKIGNKLKGLLGG